MPFGGIKDSGYGSEGILRGIFPAGTQFLGSREIARELGCSRTVVLTAWALHRRLSCIDPTRQSHGGIPPDATRATVCGGIARGQARTRVGTLALAACLRLRDQLAVGVQPGCAGYLDLLVQGMVAPAAPDLAKSERAGVPRSSARRPSAAAERDRELSRLGARAGLPAGRGGVTSSTSGALDFCSRMILDPGDEVRVEEHGFVEARWALTAAGCMARMPRHCLRESRRVSAATHHPTRQYPLLLFVQ